MKLLEVRNNLVKLSFSENESPVLGRFIAITSEGRSYVAQFVNIKSEPTVGFAVAKLLFTFNSDGIVDSYDGSIPNMESNISDLPSQELLDLLPVETPVKIGKLSQQDIMFSTDISIFEHNFTVFSEHDFEKTNFISNCARQLFQMKEKCVIIDNSNFSEDYVKIRLGKDFKLPLNEEIIEYILENDLSEVEFSTRAVLQDIFQEIKQYLVTLSDGFLPINDFINVIAAQYKESQMPELALLKNKLLKYSQENIFANSKEELLGLEKKLLERNCCIIDIRDINEKLQKVLIEYIHKELESLNKYIYLFLPLTDENSDKKLLNRLINNESIFATMFVSHSYKYSAELKRHADNILLFSPLSTQNDFAGYSTFLNKLNRNEAIIYGKLTQDVPLIVDIEDLDLGLTKDDVFGDHEIRHKIAANVSNITPAQEDSFMDDEPLLVEDDEFENINEENVQQESTPVVKSENDNKIEKDSNTIIQPIENIMEESEDLPVNTEEDSQNIQFEIENNQTIEPKIETIEPEIELPAEEDYQDLTEEDLDFIETQESENEVQNLKEDDFDVPQNFEDVEEEQQQTPVVPVYPADNDVEVSDIEFSQGDEVIHQRYGKGVIEKIIKYGNKTLCSIIFENVGKRLLDPSISEFEKV